MSESDSKIIVVPRRRYSVSCLTASDLTDNAERLEFISKVYGVYLIQSLLTAVIIIGLNASQYVREALYDRPYLVLGVGSAAEFVFVLILVNNKLKRSYPFNVIILIILSVTFGLFGGVIGTHYEIWILWCTFCVTTGLVCFLSVVARLLKIAEAFRLLHYFQCLVVTFQFTIALQIYRAVNDHYNQRRPTTNHTNHFF